MSEGTVSVLIVEDDDVLREATQLGLERLGYQVAAVGDGLEAVEFLQRTPVDLVLLDVMLPSLNGASVTRRVREFSAVPIIIVSARGDDLDTVNGLDAGADDYVVKPVNLQVLEARMRALLRRRGGAGEHPTALSGEPGSAGAVPALPGTVGTPSGPTARTAPERASSNPTPAPGAADGAPPPTAQIPRHGLLIDPRKLRVHLDGEQVHLTPTEWKLLLLLHAGGGAVVTREELLTRVWGAGWGNEARVLEVHVQRLRAKIGAEHISTARGFGYRFHA